MPVNDLESAVIYQMVTVNNELRPLGAPGAPAGGFDHQPDFVQLGIDGTDRVRQTSCMQSRV